MKEGLKYALIKHGEQFVVTPTGVQRMPMLCVASLDTFSKVRVLLNKLDNAWTISFLVNHVHPCIE